MLRRPEGPADRTASPEDATAVAAPRKAQTPREAAEALFLKGLAAHRENRLDEAVAAYGAAMALNPNDPRFGNNLGVALRVSKRYAAAEACYRRSISIEPASSSTWVNLGNVLRDQGRLDEAEAAYRRSMELDSGSRGAYCGMGLVTKDLKRLDESIGWFEKALTISPDDPELHWDLAQSLLMNGDYLRGFQEYEWRWKLKDLSRPSYSGPAWNGERMEGKRLLLFGEQGFGDVIQFARFIPLVAKSTGARIVLQVREQLVPLLAGQFEGLSEVVSREQAPPAHDAHAPLLSVPHILRLGIEDIPREPYLRAAPSRLQLAPRHPDCRLRVGLVWQGSPTQKNDRNRSLPFEKLLPLLRHTQVSFVSLQKGPAAQEPGAQGVQALVPPLDPVLNDFADTSAAIAGLDLVIAVDTSVVHLAAATGKPVWVLLSVFHDWRFDRDDRISAWYPTVRVFKQRTAGDWEEAVRRVDEALEAFLPQSPA